MEWRGKPGAITVDNGPEYIRGKLLIWAEKRGITIQHIQPGQPQQTPTSSPTIERSGMNGSINPSSKPLRRPRTALRNGSELTTTTARTWASAALDPPRS